MCFLTFCQLLLGFFLLRERYALLAAFLVTLVDALPVFGTGTVLIPWALVKLLSGNVPRAAALLALYLCTLTVRNIMEPRLMAAQAGLPDMSEDEKGEREIPVWAVIKLAEYYGVSTDYLLGLTDEP